MKKSLFGIVLLLMVLFSRPLMANAQRPSPKIGDTAPPLTLNKTVHANETAALDLNTLKGSVVVVEFWATWCLPCIPAIKHFNQLSEKFKDSPVRFIAVTDEDEGKINQFLKSQPIRIWIGLDQSRAAFDAYQAIGLPHTVVIDRQGRIAAITNPENVTETVLNDLIANKPVSLPLKDAIAEDLEWDKMEAPDALTQVIIKPSNATTGGYQARRGHFTADGAVFLNLIDAAYQISPNRVVNNLPESSKKYRVSIRVPPGREESLYPLFQQALATTFGISVRREMRETDVVVLTVPQGKIPKLQTSQAKEEVKMVMRGKIRSNKQRLETLTDQLEMILGRPVIDKTGLTGEYDWELPYSRVDKDLLPNAVRELLGLDLTETKQPIEMLIVSDATHGK